MRTILTTALLALLSIKYVTAQVLPPNDTAYQLVWEDNFNNTGPEIDGSKWIQRWPWALADTILPRCGSGNTTKTAYNRWYLANPDDHIDTNNTKVKNGTASFISKKEDFSGECWNWPTCSSSDPNLATKCNGDGGVCGLYIPNQCWNRANRTFRYTGGMLFSKYQFKYGYFEIKFRIPQTLPGPLKYSTGPNFWLWAGGNVGDPNVPVPYSEIDIFEINARTGQYTCNVHYVHYPGDPQQGTNTNQSPYTSGNISDNSWHTAGCLWTSDAIHYYLDGQWIHSVGNPLVKIDSMLPMNIIINVNNPAVNFCEQFDALSVFPYTYEVDYVKVWQLKPGNGCSQTDKLYCSNLDPDYYGRIYKTVQVEHPPSCTDAITNQLYSDILGTKSVTLDGTFSIDNNSTVLIDAQDCSPVFQQGGSVIGPAPGSWQWKLIEEIEDIDP